MVDRTPVAISVTCTQIEIVGTSALVKAGEINFKACRIAIHCRRLAVCIVIVKPIFVF